MTKRPLVDPSVYEIAHSFLSDVKGSTDADVWQLAGSIQAVCEDECRAVEEREAARFAAESARILAMGPAKDDPF